MKKNEIQQDSSTNRELTEQARRLKERFKGQGLSGFDCKEALELLLALTETDKDPARLAGRLAEDFDSIGRLLNADESKVSSVEREGPGKEAFALMGLIKSLYKAYGQEQAPPAATIKTKQDVLYHVNNAVPCTKGEKLLAIYLNSKNEVLGTWILQEGPVTTSTVSPKRAIEGALRYNGQGLIFVHRHNRASANPTKQEAALIKVLCAAASAVDLIVHDHLIFSRLGLYSAIEDGLISSPAKHFSMAASPLNGSFRINKT